MVEVSAEVVLGVDIGTTATKVVAVDAGGHTLAVARRPYPLDEPRPGEAVQDPDAIHRAAREAMAEAGGAARAAGATVRGIAFSSAMHGLMAVDEAGRALTPLITWADERATDQADRLRASADGLALQRRTGTPVHPMSPLTKLMWFAEREPALFGRASRWAGIREHLLAGLCGEWLVDVSLASGTGLMSLLTEDWDDRALQLAGIDARQLSTLVPTTTVVHGLRQEPAASLGLDARVAVIVGAGDGPLANLGIGAVRPGVAACSIGTSGAIRVAVDRPAVDAGGHVFCYALAHQRWVIGGAVNNGGVVLPWLAGIIGEDARDPAGAVLELAARAPVGSAGLMMLPQLFGERAPHWTTDARGAWVGLTHAHGREHLARAALEGICLQLAVVLDSVRDAGVAVHEVRGTGGFARSPFWRQLLADVLGSEVRYVADVEGSSVGAALLGWHALGRIESLDAAASMNRVVEVRSPDPHAAGVYGRLRTLYASALDSLAPVNRALRMLDSPGAPESQGQHHVVHGSDS